MPRSLLRPAVRLRGEAVDETLLDMGAWGVIVLLLVGFQLHCYLAEPTDLDEDLDSFD
jgi:hypothetical protein